MRLPGFKIGTLMFASAALAPICGTAVAQENAKLPPAITGYLLVERPGAGIEAIQLPSLRTATIRPATAPNHNSSAMIHAMSGPDSAGRIAFIEEQSSAGRRPRERHLLKTIRLDGTQEATLFSRAGTAFFGAYHSGSRPIGEFLALSPVGGRVAFLTDFADASKPDIISYDGSIEIWNIETGQNTKTNIRALDSPMAWFPDGKRLAYVKCADPPQPGASRDSARGTGARKRNWVPAVFVRNVDAGTESFLHLGEDPIVSQDGRCVLVNHDETWVRVDIATGSSTAVRWFGDADIHSRVVACVTSDVVLASTVRFRRPPRRLGRFSALDPATRIRTFGIATLNTDDFQAISSFESAGVGSFGQVQEK